ncbi:hypothetical protein [Rhizobium laguerreae]|uniref:hypothetical protein n=1 Tax=Rhizobium laguerreae TaxID=1076926 RepID=UPI001C929968|nr:hypothetical protein [Rhizobium laguerreae]MBY3386413.1 hypothetical protein [Rhizobium laguerreae]MBY3400496.1 hypothetical protein [Rhizobium laguerreae]MBY3407434.1 hypothetical protein [Rhizobium laguerreae]
MALSIIQIFRDYVTNGIPSSGNHKPAKSEIRSWGAWVESIISSFLSNGGLVYTSRAALFADLAHAANSSAWVIGDATAAYNGVYMKAGASGTGSWTRVADLPYSFVQLVDAGAGTANAIQLTSTIPTSQSVLRVANIFEANAGNVTVSENGGSAKSLLTSSGNQIAAAGLTAGMMIVYVDDGAAFRLLSDQTSAAIQAAAEAAALAAAGSASAASASAAAAAASAAGVSLPAVDANRMLVDNAAGTTRESKTLSETMTILAGAVSGRTSTFSLDNNTLYKVRSLKDRWLDSYRLAEELQFTGGGATATDAAVLQALFDRAKAAGRGEIILPRGDIKLEALCFLKNPAATNSIRIVGQGPASTRFLNTSAGQVMFWIGDDADGVNKTSGITFEGLGLAASVAPNDSGSGFFLRNTSRILFKDVFIEGLRNGWSLGVNAGNLNNSVYTRLHNCGCNTPGTSGVAMIRLGSGGILNVGGDAYGWNTNGGIVFIEHDNASYNWDGLYITNQFMEHWSKYVYSHGKGIVNAEWTGGQMDRANIFFHLQPDSGISGDNTNWNIHDTQLLGFGAGLGDYGLFTSHGGGNINNVCFRDNIVKGLSNRGVFTTSGDGVKVHGNQFVNCGNSGTSVLQIDQPPANGVISVTNNDIYLGNNPVASNYTYGIDWIGSTNVRRKSFGNNVVAGSSGAENGTA